MLLQNMTGFSIGIVLAAMGGKGEHEQEENCRADPQIPTVVRTHTRIDDLAGTLLAR
ncbi:MAG: hypothetical protein HC898_09215 [Phycisphaerales bacterium]|nr:hypothetical protein [Phycisphaerales bacterium]